MKIQKDIRRQADRKAAKRETKRREIAESAIEALKTYGYAQTTLRDISAHSDLSLGMLHYYFESKEDLLIYCVRQYKVTFVETIRRATEDVNAPEDIQRAFCEALVDTILSRADIHRLWYDIRSQAMFDKTFVPIVTEIETMMQSLLEPFVRSADDAVDISGLYARVDGVFRFLLQDHLETRSFDRGQMLQMFVATLQR